MGIKNLNILNTETIQLGTTIIVAHDVPPYRDYDHGFSRIQKAILASA